MNSRPTVYETAAASCDDHELGALGGPRGGLEESLLGFLRGVEAGEAVDAVGIAELIDASFGALTAGAAAVVTAPAAFQVRRASEVALRALDLIRARATPEEVEANG